MDDSELDIFRTWGATFHIDHDIVGNVIDRDVPLLRAQLQLIVDSFGDGD